jgi:hypothetical protein
VEEYIRRRQPRHPQRPPRIRESEVRPSFYTRRIAPAESLFHMPIWSDLPTDDETPPRPPPPPPPRPESRSTFQLTALTATAAALAPAPAPAPQPIEDDPP